MSAIDDLSSWPFYHGTNADLNEGDLIGPGYSSNYGARKKAKYVYQEVSGQSDEIIPHQRSASSDR
jgi:hypothetical protein